MGALVQQLAAQQNLQPLDLRTDRRLGEPQRLGGLGKAAQVGDA